MRHGELQRKTPLQRTSPLKASGEAALKKDGTPRLRPGPARKTPRTKPCAMCGMVITPSDTRTRYCPTCARVASKPLHRGREIACAECGKVFYAKAADIRRGAKYCSRSCLHSRDRRAPEKLRAMSEQFSVERRGKGNPAWKGRDTAGSIYRVFNIKLKGEACCRNCGSTRHLHLHHIVPRSMCRAARRDLRNGLPLCASCHSHWHARSITIYRDAFRDNEWAYVSSLQLLGQDIATWLDERYPVRPSALRSITGDRMGAVA
jgi:hypothetical protein